MRSSIGALVGIALTATITHIVLGSTSDLPLLVAPMGASAVLLFAVPASPLAQPWSLIGGNLVSALVGVSCAQWIDQQVFAASAAIALSIMSMFALRCVHPPSGAVALTAVLGGSTIHALGYKFVIFPIAINSICMLIIAILFHRVTGHRYPHRHQEKNTLIRGQAHVAFTRDDLDAVLKRRNEMLDVDVDDLESVLNEVEARVYRRHMRDLTCKGVMTSDVKSVTPQMPASLAWEMLHLNKVKALPVIDEGHRVIGIVTQMDFIHQMAAKSMCGVRQYQAHQASDLKDGFQSQPGLNTVRDMMSTPVKTALIDQTIVDLVPLFASYGHHHLPVINDDGILCGMVTQADLIAGLHRHALDGVPANA